MDLSKLFETQNQLDERIVREKGLEGRDLLPEKILALQVELGELANEWRGFKFWSTNREPSERVYSTTSDRKNFDYYRCFQCRKSLPSDVGKEYQGELYADCPDCEIEMHAMKTRNPMLEEFVDVLHFILSIGLENAEFFGDDVPINVIAWEAGKQVYKSQSITHQFSDLFLDIAGLYDATAGGKAYDFQDVEDAYNNIVGGFLGLGEMLGFTWEQIEESYFEKNRINHERQTTGY